LPLWQSAGANLAESLPEVMIVYSSIAEIPDLEYAVSESVKNLMSN